MDDAYFKTAEEFIKINPARKLIINALKELSPTKGNRFGFIISFAIALVFAIIIGCSDKTIELFKNVTGILLSMQLAIFGCIFTVYSILLAFLNDGYTKRLAKIEYEGKNSMLKKCTTYYESVLFLYFINFCITGTVSLLMNCMEPLFRLTKNLYFDTGLSIILLLVYFWFSFRVFYELKSTIYNTIVLFRASIAYRLYEFGVSEVNKEKEDKANDDK